MKTDIFMPIYVGDYIKDTQDLSLLEHGVYFKLIINYWNNQGALTNDIERLKRLCNATSNAEADALVYILHTFFEEKNNTFYHKRIEKELKAASEKRKQSKARAKKAADARWNATSNAQAMLEECPSPSPSHSYISKKKNNKKENLKPDDVSDETWGDFKKLRDKKKATITKTVVDRILSEVAKTDLTNEEAFQEICERGWSSFKAEWINKNRGQNENNGRFNAKHTATGFSGRKSQSEQIAEGLARLEAKYSGSNESI